MRLRKPWSHYANQPDGLALKAKLAAGTELVRDKEKEEEDSLRDREASVEVTSPLKLQDSDSVSDLKADRPIKDSKYVLRVLVPCYREELDIVKNTCIAALNMRHPEGKLYVYLCDDGRDGSKKAWVDEMNALGHLNIMYVSRPDEFRGHGKAGNLNYCLKQVIYAEGTRKNEMVAIFDADMVTLDEFAERLLPYFENDRYCVMVQTPQTFHNVPMNADFFDAHNVNFFQYLLPASSAWNTVSCCGTNFIVSARALERVNWFPTLSVTEDMYLSMLLLAAGGHIHYHGENLVVGEAPTDLRQIFQQRSRWAKGTMQVFFKDNPLFKGGLNLIQKLSFFNSGWAYITSALMNPLFVMINAGGIVFGLFPVKNLDFTVAMLFVSYYALFYVLLHYNPVPNRHTLGLWVVGKMGHFFSFMSLKAIMNVMISGLSGKTMQFKVTQKKVAHIGDKEKGSEAEVANAPNRHMSMDSQADLLEREAIVRRESLVDESEVAIEQADEEAAQHDENKKESKKKGKKAARAVEEPRDSSKKDVIFHGLMCLFIVFVIFYGIWVTSGGTKFLPEYIANDRGIHQRNGIKLFQVAWMLQFLISYSLPLWYACLPNNFSIQAKVLKGLALIDSFLSLMLVVLTVLLFQLGFLASLPSANSPLDLPLSETPFWVKSLGDQARLGNYIYDTAILQRIPVIVIYSRNNRAPNTPNEGGQKDETSYRQALVSMVETINDKEFPAVVILEPGWMQESIYETRTLAEAFPGAPAPQPDEGVPTTTYLAYDFATWNRLMTLFNRFANNVHSKVWVYLDAADPHFHWKFNDFGINTLQNQTFPGRGFALNMASFYDTSMVKDLGNRVHAATGKRFILDSSRNGGEFSQRPIQAQARCQLDPPKMNVGEEPSWVLDEFGFDGMIWGKVAGRSDGRMFEVDLARECLIDHDVECDSSCPVVPSFRDSRGVFFRPPRCQCDQAF